MDTIRFGLPALVLPTLGLVIALAQEASPVNLAWQDVASRYHTFEEIKPVLVNTSQKSIFLSRIYPDGSAQLQRLSESTGEWESGSWGIRCGTVAKPIVPIEIKPRAERAIGVYWQLSTDDWEKPKHFKVGRSSQARPLEGRYRFVLRYALEPWTLVHHPTSIYTAVSPEFLISGS